MNNKDMIQTRKTINVAKILAPIIGSRDIADKLKETILDSKEKMIDLDFTNVEFISRSAAHELLTIKEDLKRKFLKKKEIYFINLNKDVKEMLRIIAANRVAPDISPPPFNPKKIDIKTLL